MTQEQIIEKVIEDNRQLFEQLHSKFMTWAQFQALIRQGYSAMLIRHLVPDHPPVLKLFNAKGQWLISELLPEEPDVAIGLYQDTNGATQLNYFSLSNLIEQHRVFADVQFQSQLRLSEYHAPDSPSLLPLR